MNSESWTIKKLLDWSVQYFQQKNIDSPRLNAEWLMCHAFGMNRVQLYLQFDKILTPQELKHYKELLLRRIDREPLQYILGKFEFMGLEILLSPAVLIPRPETEVLVEVALRYLSHYPAPVSILEVGVGSGCIPVALHHFAKKKIRYLGLEISGPAIEMAKQNFALHQLEPDHFIIRQADFLSPASESFLKEKFHVILSNPPYVTPAEWQELQPEVKNFEPKEALVAPGDDPFVFYRKLSQMETHLFNEGVIIVEMSYPHHRTIAKIFEQRFEVEIIRDYSGKERILVAKRKNHG